MGLSGTHALWGLSLSLHCLTLLLYTTTRPGSVPNVLSDTQWEHPSSSQGRRLQASPTPLGAGAVPRRHAAQRAQAAGSVMQGAPRGGARPATTIAIPGPGQVPINQLAENGAYAPGTGQLFDPLSYMWVDPETGRLYIRAYTTVVPPDSFANPPPPKFNPNKPALTVWAKGGHGLQVTGEDAGDDPSRSALVVFNAYDSTASLEKQANLITARNNRVLLTQTSIIGDWAPPAPGVPALSVRGRVGQPTLHAVDNNASTVTFGVGNNAVQSSSLTVFGDSLSETGVALAAIGTPTVSPLAAVVQANGAFTVALEVTGDNTVTSGPISVDGTRNSTAFKGQALSVTGRTALTGSVAVSGKTALGGELAVRGKTALGGDVTVGGTARGQQRSLTVNGRLTVKQAALFESSVEVWRSMTARWYFWWRPSRKHYPFTAPPPESTPGGRKM